MKWVLSVAMLIAFSGVSLAQDNNNPDELKKNLADALNQLKAAQDRKNELANENEGLKNKIAETEKQLAEQRQKTAELEDKTWFWRSHYFAWLKFIERYPRLLAQWKVFMDANPLNAPSLLPTFEEEVVPVATVETPTTQPAEEPTTQPVSQ